MKAILTTSSRGAAEDLECVLYDYTIDFTFEQANGVFIYTISATSDELDGLIENEINRNNFEIKR